MTAPSAASARAADAEPRAADAAPRHVVVYGLGALLIGFNAWFITYTYLVVQALGWTQTALLRGPIVVLFLLVPLNLLFLRLAHRWAMTQAELVLLYVMLCVATCAGGQSFVQMLVNQIAAPFYHATAANAWQEQLWPHIPAWLAPRDPAIINGFFRGNATLYDPVVLAGWAVPVLAWGAFMFAIFWVLLCATSLLRRQWVEEERLTFPLVLLPLEMTRNGGATPFWKSRWMWLGFLLAAGLESLNYVNFLYPSVPGVPIKPVGANQLDQYLTLRPWSQAGTLRIAFYPFVIGIGYLLSLDVSFSCWFLYLCVKAANIASALLGLAEAGGAGPANRAPFIREQGVGAFLAIALFSLWMARRALLRAWQERKLPTGADRNELMSSRLAFVGGGSGLLFLAVFLTVAGFALPVAAVFVFVYLCFALALARIVAEAGAGWAYAPSWTPVAFTTDLFGANTLPTKNLAVLQSHLAWTSDMRDVPMAQQVQGVKLGQAAGVPPRAFLCPLVWAAALGILCAFWAHLDIYYTYGHATAKVRVALSNLATGPARTAASLLISPTLADTAGLIAAGAGGVLATGLFLLRQTLPWWPLNPLGYALATTQSMDYLWFPFLLAWLVKWLTLRYGGIKAFRAALPFFLGLILGDYVVPVLWSVFGMATGYQQYMAFPH